MLVRQSYFYCYLFRVMLSRMDSALDCAREACFWGEQGEMNHSSLQTKTLIRSLVIVRLCVSMDTVTIVCFIGVVFDLLRY
jgi:hypothetical protein